MLTSIWVTLGSMAEFFHIRALPDLIIAICYFAIPTALMVSAGARRRIMGRGLFDPANLVLVCFAVFILVCGSGHLIDSWFIFRGKCAAFESIKVISTITTAIASTTTVLLLLPLLPAYILLLYKPVDLEVIRRHVAEVDAEVAAIEEERNGG